MSSVVGRWLWQWRHRILARRRWEISANRAITWTEPLSSQIRGKTTSLPFALLSSTYSTLRIRFRGPKSRWPRSAAKRRRMALVGHRNSAGVGEAGANVLRALVCRSTAVISLRVPVRLHRSGPSISDLAHRIPSEYIRSGPSIVDPTSRAAYRFTELGDLIRCVRVGSGGRSRFVTLRPGNFVKEPP
jgi:hypothetical protein